MKIGCHVANNGFKMLVGSVEEALSYDANCFMIYLGAPQNTYRKQISEQRSEEAMNIWKQAGYDPNDIIVHAPYIVNLASPDDVKHQFAIDFLTKEVINVDLIGVTYLVLHPGAHTGSGSEAGIKRIIKGLNQIISNTPNAQTVILLETMAGKGTECGINFNEIKEMIDGVDNKKRIGVCLDSCHISDAGYDIINNYEQVINDFDNTIGLSYLHCIHLNDSKNIKGTHKDRHENFGFGYLGFNTLMQFVNDERLKDVPKILETPYIEVSKDEEYPPYKQEIVMIKTGVFNENLKDEVIKANQE